MYAELIPGPTTEIFMQKAKEHRIWIHGGSISEVNPDGVRTYNTSVLVNPEGQIVARYSKLHNFDMTLPDGAVCVSLTAKSTGMRLLLWKLNWGIWDLPFVMICVFLNCFG